MNMRVLRQNLGFVTVMLVIAVVGVAAALYVLVHERLQLPFAGTYPVNVELSAADGVVPGYGQPVDVAGVPIGTITAARVLNGQALITATIERSQLPHVYRDATAALEPVTPLKDMELDLTPGDSQAGVMPNNGTIGIANTTSPVELEDLLASLDGDTRTFLGSLISSLGTGTAGQGANIRSFLVALSPTTAQVNAITAALAERRTEIADLIHNLAVVTRAASRDQQLTNVVEAGNATLRAISTQNSQLRQSIAMLPGTLRSTSTALVDATGLADALGPTLTALDPAVRNLPGVLRKLGPFAAKASGTLRSDVAPLVQVAQKPLRELTPTATTLAAITPRLTQSFELVNYLLNELNYNGGVSNPGMMFWLDWFAHDLDSTAGNQDADGSIGRAMGLVSCDQLTNIQDLGSILGSLLGVSGVCPGS